MSVLLQRKALLLRRLSLMTVLILLIPIPLALSDDLNETSRSTHVFSAESHVIIVIETARILEDRDFGAAEIYLKARIDTGSFSFTQIYQNINDGDTIQLGWTVLDDIRERFTLRVEIWESDDAFNEAGNDFLGYIEYTRNPLESTNQWHDAIGRSGGNNNLEAQLYITETVEGITGSEPTSPPGGGGEPLTSNLPLVLGAAAIVGIVAIVALASFKKGIRPSFSSQQRPVVLVICPYCGGKTEQGVAHCHNCGAAI